MFSLFLLMLAGCMTYSLLRPADRSSKQRSLAKQEQEPATVASATLSHEAKSHA